MKLIVWLIALTGCLIFWALVLWLITYIFAHIHPASNGLVIV